MIQRRPILGIISGLFFGIFAAADLVLFGLVPLDSIVLVVVPIVGLLLGIVLGFRPLRRAEGPRPTEVVPPEAAAQAVAGNAPAAVTPSTPAEGAPPPPPPPPPD